MGERNATKHYESPLGAFAFDLEILESAPVRGANVSIRSFTSSNVFAEKTAVWDTLTNDDV